MLSCEISQPAIQRAVRGQNCQVQGGAGGFERVTEQGKLGEGCFDAREGTSWSVVSQYLFISSFLVNFNPFED
jgi:hypothetical protein